MIEKRKNKEAIIIIVLLVLLVGVIGFLVWNMYFANKQVITSNTQANTSQTGSTNEDSDNVYKELRDEITSLKATIKTKDNEIANLKSQIQKAEESIKDNKREVSVVEAVSYTYEKLRVKLPKIQNGGTNAEKLNKKMLNEVLKATYSSAILTNDILNNEDSIWWGKEGFTVKYDFCTKNNIIAIYVSITENTDEGFPGTGDGITRFNYFYDIKNDNELSFNEGVKKMGIQEYVINNMLMGDLLLIQNGKFLKEYKAI